MFQIRPAKASHLILVRFVGSYNHPFMHFGTRIAYSICGLLLHPITLRFVEILFQIVLQFVAEVFIQILFELGFYSVVEAIDKKPKPVIAFFGYLFLGALAGAISLLFFNDLMIKDAMLRIANLIVTPVVAGLVMAALGRLREKKGDSLIRLDKFSYGFAFAFAMALVRFLWGA